MSTATPQDPEQAPTAPKEGLGILACLALLGLSYAVMMLLGLPLFLLDTFSHQDHKLLWSALVSVGGTASAGWVGLRWAGIPARPLMRWPNLDRRLWATLLLGEAVVLCAATFLSWLGQHWLPVPETLKYLGTQRTALPWIVLGAPLAEELLFRGAVAGGLARRRPEVQAILISSLLFSLFHLFPLQILTTLPMGLWWGWVRLRTGSLWPSVILHVIHNGVAMAGGMTAGWAVFAVGVAALALASAILRWTGSQSVAAGESPLG